MKCELFSIRNSWASLSWARLLLFCFPFVEHKVWLWYCVDDYEDDATLGSEITGRTFRKRLEKTLQYNFMSCCAPNVGRVPGKRLWYFSHDSTALFFCGVLSFSLKATTSIPIARVVLFISWQSSVVRRKNKQSRKPWQAQQSHVQLGAWTRCLCQGVPTVSVSTGFLVTRYFSLLGEPGFCFKCKSSQCCWCGEVMQGPQSRRGREFKEESGISTNSQQLCLYPGLSQKSGRFSLQVCPSPGGAVLGCASAMWRFCTAVCMPWDLASCSPGTLHCSCSW